MYRVTELHREEELSYGNVLQEQRSKHPINLSFALFCAEARRRPLAPGTLQGMSQENFFLPRFPEMGFENWKTACLELNFLFIPWGDTAHVQVKVRILWLHAPDHEAVPLPTPLFHLSFWLWEEMNQGKSFKTTFLSSHISVKKQNQTMDGFFNLASMKALLTCKFPPLQNWEEWVSLPGVGSHPEFPFTWATWDALWLVVLGTQTQLRGTRSLAAAGEVCFGKNMGYT